MTEPNNAGGTPSGVTRRLASERVTAGLALVVTLLVGVVLGVAIDRTLFQLPGHHWHGKPDVLWMLQNRHPDWHRVRDRMVRDLKLTDVQAARVDTIMTHRSAAFRTVRSETETRVKAMLDTTRAMIDSVLTPAQRAELQKIRARHTYGRPGEGPPPDHAPPGNGPAAGGPPPDSGP